MERKSSFSTLPPVIFHNYEIEKKIGTGAFGDIFRASRKDGEPVSIRTFKDHHRTMDELDTSELDIVSQFTHENIVQILDTVWHLSPAFSGGVELFLITEYCSRGNLDDYILDHGSMNEGEVQTFIKQMSQGLKALREKAAIVHGDLKPSNILVHQIDGAPEVTYKIGDLSLTKMFCDGDAGAIAFSSDSPTFIAPEVLRTFSSIHPFMLGSVEESKVDLWSLGVLILHCFNGETPFNGSDLSQISSDKEIDITSQIPKGSNSELVELVQNLLHLDPGDRLDFPTFLRNPFLREHIWFTNPHRHILPCNAGVTSLCLDAKYIICGLETGLILVFCRKTFSRVKRLDSHRKTVSAVASNREIIISGSQDTTIAVWSKENFERLQVLYHHRNTVIGIEIIGASAYSACLDGTHKAFSIDYKKLYARRNGMGQRRYSFQEHSNEAFKEELEYKDERSGKTYPAHWRDHDHMHTVAGIIAILVYVAEDSEFRPFHILSSRAFSCLRPQLLVRLRDDGNEHFVRKIPFESHVRQVQACGDQLFLLHWDGAITMFSVEEMLSQMPNDELLSRTLVQKSPDESARATWFCVQDNSVAFYNGENVHMMEYKL